MSTSGIEIIDLMPGENGAAADINENGDILLRSSSAGMSILRSGVRSPLLPLQGAAFSRAWRMNIHGDVVGSAVFFQPFSERGVLWTAGLPALLPQSAPARADEPRGINDNGTAVGLSGATPPGPFDVQAAVWRNGTVTTLDRPAGSPRAEALAINNSDWIAGSVWVALGTEATLWRGSEIVDLGVLGRAFAVSNSGIVVGLAAPDRSFKWENGALTLFESMSNAASVNDAGDVAGSVYGAGHGSAVVWKADGTRIDLGSFPGDVESSASGINNHRWVVGSSCDATFVCRAVLWKLRPNPAELFAQLKAEVAAISGTNTRSLMALLDNAEKHYTRDRGAVGPLLNAFITQVANMVARGDLTPAQGASLTEKAQQILDQM